MKPFVLHGLAVSLVRILLAVGALLSGSAIFAAAQSSGGQAPATVPASPPAQSPSGSQAAPRQPSIRVTTELVHLVVTVEDKRHEFVTDLAQSDFKIFEDGVPQQIRFFGRETDLPLRIGLLLDTSNSIRPRLQFEKDAAIDFLDRVIRRGQDMAFLMTFDNEPQIIQDYTDHLSLLTSSIQDQRAGGGTALNDAICMASEKLLHAPPPKGPDSDMRRVIVLISDGVDNLSDRALSDAVDASIRSEAAVYSVSTNTDWVAVDNPSKPNKYNFDPGDKVLKQFSDQTGGRVFFPYSVDDLAESFSTIGAELRSQYFIAYAPSNPPVSGQYRKIDVRTDRKGVFVRARKGYYAVIRGSGPSAGK